MENPFTLSFGKEPVHCISRVSQTEQVIYTFTKENPNNRTYIITGVRGSGKTVALSIIANSFRSRKDWIVTDLNPAADLMQDFAAKLYNDSGTAAILKRAKVNLSSVNVSLEIENKETQPNIEVLITNLLKQIHDDGKKVMVIIDEVASVRQMRAFIKAFQIFTRKKLPVFLLMAGLPKNVDSLQNSDALTFLLRAPKIFLSPLDISSVARAYQSVFMFSFEKAVKMAKITMGYPYAFQILGYYTFEKNDDFTAAIPELQSYLYSCVYEKIWNELSEKDKRIVAAAVQCKTDLVKDIREELGMETYQFSPYKNRLIKKGLIDPDIRGIIVFLLPFFDTFVADTLLSED